MLAGSLSTTWSVCTAQKWSLSFFPCPFFNPHKISIFFPWQCLIPALSFQPPVHILSHIHHLMCRVKSSSPSLVLDSPMGHTFCDVVHPTPSMCFQDSSWHPLTYSSFLLDITCLASLGSFQQTLSPYPFTKPCNGNGKEARRWSSLNLPCSLHRRTPAARM